MSFVKINYFKFDRDVGIEIIRDALLNEEPDRDIPIPPFIYNSVQRGKWIKSLVEDEFYQTIQVSVRAREDLIDEIYFGEKWTGIFFDTSVEYTVIKMPIDRALSSLIRDRNLRTIGILENE